MRRRPIEPEIEARLLTETRRRCCLCVFLEQDWSVKQVQIAHISRNRDDNRHPNLAVLCLRHHDQYDSRPSQSKRYTPSELKFYKSRLIEAMRGFGDKPPAGSPLASMPPGDIGQVVGALPERTKTFPRNRIPDEIVQVVLARLGDQDAVEHLGRNATVQVAAGGARIVGFADDDRWKWRSYLLTPNGSEWRLQGPIETFTKGETPEWTYVNGIPFSLLTVSHVLGTGTGVYLRGTSCYRIGESGIVLLFTYPTQGYVNGWVPFERQIRSRISEPKSELDERYRIEADYTVEYRADPSLPLFRRTPIFNVDRRLRLQWDPDSGMLLTGPGSTSLAEVQGFFNDGNEEFLSRYERHLVRIARTGRALQKRLLAHFLTVLAPSPTRRRLTLELNA